MTELNLLNYINLSNSEIYQIECGEIEPDEENEQKSEKKWVGFKLPTYLLFAGAALLLITVIIIVYFSFMTPDTISDNDTMPDNISLKKDNITKEFITGIKQKFQKVGSITFKEEKELPVNKQPIPPKKITIKQLKKKPIVKKQVKMITLPVNSTKKITKPIKTKLTTPYFALYENLSRQELIKLKKKVKRSQLSYSVDKTKMVSRTIWKLYKQDPNGTKKIAERSVIFIRTFNTKTLAVNYAKQNKMKAIIVSKELEERFYFISVSPFSSQKNAVKFVKNTPFLKKSVRIIKGSP